MNLVKYQFSRISISSLYVATVTGSCVTFSDDTFYVVAAFINVFTYIREIVTFVIITTDGGNFTIF